MFLLASHWFLYDNSYIYGDKGDDKYDTINNVRNVKMIIIILGTAKIVETMMVKMMMMMMMMMIVIMMKIN